MYAKCEFSKYRNLLTLKQPKKQFIEKLPLKKFTILETIKIKKKIIKNKLIILLKFLRINSL